jgi:hypothetical protein
VEANERFLQIANTRIDIKGYSTTTRPPAQFRVFSVTDTWVTGERRFPGPNLNRPSSESENN